MVRCCKVQFVNFVNSCYQIVKGERDKDEEETRRAQYLSANCVIFTYMAGDISKLVDDHFTKALGQNSDRGG